MTIEQAIDDLMDASRSIAEVAESESDEANRINAQNVADDCKQIAELLRELQERRKAPEIVRCGECRHKGTRNCVANTWATIFGFEVKDDFYCGLAERRTDENNNLHV